MDYGSALSDSDPPGSEIDRNGSRMTWARLGQRRMSMRSKPKSCAGRLAIRVHRGFSSWRCLPRLAIIEFELATKTRSPELGRVLGQWRPARPGSLASSRFLAESCQLSRSKLLGRRQPVFLWTD